MAVAFGIQIYSALQTWFLNIPVTTRFRTDEDCRDMAESS